MSNKIIINIGHGGIIYDPGAVGNGREEHKWNKDFAENYLLPAAKRLGVEVKTIVQGYYRMLVSDINQITNRGDVIISLHLNAASSSKASGPEMLYCKTSRKSKELANLLQQANVSVTQMKDRGIKGRLSGERGSWLLAKTKAPCVIIESGFINNLEDMLTLESKRLELAEAYIKAVMKFMEMESRENETR